MFIIHVKANLTRKRENPADFIEYCEVIRKCVKSLNPNMPTEFLRTKYSLYRCKFDEFVKIQGFREIINISDLGFYSKTNTSLLYYLDRGWSNEEAKQFLVKRQAISAERLGNEAYRKIIVKQCEARRNNEKYMEHLKTSAFPTQVGFWKNKINPKTNRFYTDNEIIEKIRLERSKNSKKSYETKLKNDSFNSIRSIKTWLKGGFSLTEALSAIKTVQSTNSLSRYIEKYGEIDGTIKFKERQQKRLDTLSKKSDSEKLDILIRQTKSLKMYSNISYLIFTKLIQILKAYGISELTYFYGPNEHFIYDTDFRKIYFYDFYIKELNFYVEFNGIKYHPKTTLSKSDWTSWKNPISGITADEQHAKDMRKLELIKKVGGTYHIIWEDDCIEKTYSDLFNIISKKYDTFKNNDSK